MPEACLFCGVSPPTNEHVISRWISGRVQAISPFTPEHGAPAVRAPNASRFYMNRIIDIQVRVACTTCNSVFFNELESPCRPFFERAMADQPSVIDTELKRDLATWAYKTALLLELHVTPRHQWPAFLLRQCRDLPQLRRPPVGVRVWVGRYDARENFPEMVHGARLSELSFRHKGAEYHGAQVIFTLCYLPFIVVFWHSAPPDDFPMDSARIPEDALIPVWPALVGISSWPPKGTVSYVALDALASWKSPNWAESYDA